MDHLDTATEILDTLLGYLGFVIQIERDPSNPDPTLQIMTEEADLLIGREGERLDDIQYLVNRLLQIRMPDAPRVRVDVQHYRTIQEDKLIEEAERMAERVVNSGRPLKLEPLNSYYRRIIHNHFLDHPDVSTWSPQDSARLKRITIRPRKKSRPAEEASSENA